MSHIIWEREYWRNMQTYIPAATPLLQTTPLLHFLFNACYAGFGQWTFRFKRIGKGQSTPTFRKDAILLQLLPLQRDVSLASEQSPISLQSVSNTPAGLIVSINSKEMQNFTKTHCLDSCWPINMQTKETSPLMHFPLVDALAPPPPMCQPKGTERHKFWSKLRKLCQNPIYLQLPTATCTQLPHMPSRRLAQCNLQRRVPPPPPHKARKSCTQLLPQYSAAGQSTERHKFWRWRGGLGSFQEFAADSEGGVANSLPFQTTLVPDLKC